MFQNGFACLLALTLMQQEHQHHQMPSDAQAPAWTFMQDGVVFGLFNHQGGPRGGDELKAPNWWMGMAHRTSGRSQVTLTGMFSLDPATVGKRGYRELFQVGETADGRPLVDRQHPHDFFMQLAAVWRWSVSDTTGVTLAGAPVGEPAIGPVAFMHRASAGDNPFAPLGHHTFDSTHIAYGVITAAVDHGPWLIEGSVFNGREPDENRWDFDFGALDSVSARLWFRPTEQWGFQVSSAHLTNPEALEPGDIQRTTASASWTQADGDNLTAATVAYGANAAHGRVRQSVFGEATRRRGLTSVFGRIEARQSETAVLLGQPGDAARNTVGTLTLGAVRDITPWRGMEIGFGGALTVYGVPEVLRATHGSHPVSAQLFVRVRPPAGLMGRMLDTHMGAPMKQAMPGHDMSGMKGSMRE